MSFLVTQGLEQLIHRMKKRPGISFHALDRVPVQRGERPLTISAQQLADPNDYVEWCAQFVAHPSEELRFGPIVLDQFFMNRGGRSREISCGFQSGTRSAIKLS